ncbi:MAG: imidazolonepropionase [Gemmatimonadetes bacterium RBG_16_66_8]|nr:MAG: imidazolonepropionase [Gemmatimonadetes bacterium RBG_16_66_8]
MSTLLVGATQVVTCRGPARARRGAEMSALEVLTDAAVLMDDDGIISRVGPYSELRAGNAATVVEVQGTLFPGFVDCHTHAVFGAPRLADHERRARGETYQAIAAAGGGILSSVRDVRARSSDALLDSARGRLSAMLALGTTTVEIKSGYGLALDHELKQLDVVRALAAEPVSVIGTFLGAHEVPEEHRANPDAYVDLVIHEMLPAIKRQGVARFCDVFCEPGVFTVAQSRAVLEAAKALGFGLKLHADELEPSGGAELAAALGATSADHLAAISEAGIAALAASPAVAVLLPGTMLFLGRPRQAPARRLIDAGAAVALATDFNPGSSPGLSLPLMAMLGVSQLRMLPAEAMVAITVNAAAALGEAATRGQLAPGFRADVVLAAVEDWRELPYWYGVNPVRQVWIRGAACHSSGAPLHLAN